MKHRILTSLVVALAALFPIASQAQDWAYAGYYPYMYLSSSDTWIYMPDNAPLVYDYSAGDWTTNPLGGKLCDIRSLFDESPLRLYLYPDDGYVMSVDFNLSGVDYGYFYETETYGEYESSIYYRYTVDAASGRCVMHGDFLDGTDYSFTLILDFVGGNGGDFTIIGMFPFFYYTTEIANHIGTIKGEFFIQNPDSALCND